VKRFQAKKNYGAVSMYSMQSMAMSAGGESDQPSRW
jgi:hypothetical protein